MIIAFPFASFAAKNYIYDDTSCASQGTSDNASVNRYCHENEKGESSETIEKREECSDVDARCDQKRSNQTRTEYSFSEDKSLKLSSKRGSDTLIRSSRSEEEIIDEGRQSNNSLSSPAAAVASLDNGSPDRVRERYQYSMPRRTSRNQRSSSSGCSNISKETSLGSESFYSVRTSSIGSEATSTKLKNLNQTRSELLKLVEELKHQLGRSHERKESKKPIQRTTFPDLCCNGSSCQSPKAKGPPRCACSAASCSYARKSRPSGAKRYFRPVLGGAPFVICYKCFEMLHMPADFLISTKKLNKLKCRACSEILPLPFPAARAPPVPQASAEYYGNSPEGPVSISEEFGALLAESCSTETGPALNTSGVSSAENPDVDGPGLPLHRVMGYPSARLLLY